ncbi:hypothetical protein JHK82_026281 [Glycine max]|uniref:Uncharacterized protein n=2 Tax=Glycine subgen. Soja TaxID=1462606 RepID=K7LGA1_SOYBN|nr:hypothetical protein JHK87_026224 [Glycine soja]KAG5008357.1 hypothetical protein JHK85_026899 [Glycine max]KAG5014146.1 hypothetical protein JHK86_026407 [Glycine max]KAG5135093.1 hypothetical protein JHK82_026281 [Glycine max]KAH1044966.1 hypothetical protein GYH30_026277 [Glycine max]
MKQETTSDGSGTMVLRKCVLLFWNQRQRCTRWVLFFEGVGINFVIIFALIRG